MSWLRQRARHARLIVAVALLAVLLSSLTSASVPAPNGVISGCYDTSKGDLRVTDPSTGTPAACSNKETPITWNQTGPQGPAGPPGPQGPPGASGSGNLVVVTFDLVVPSAEATCTPASPGYDTSSLLTNPVCVIHSVPMASQPSAMGALLQANHDGQWINYPYDAPRWKAGQLQFFDRPGDCFTCGRPGVTVLTIRYWAIP